MLVMSKSTNFETFRHMGFVPDPWCFLVQIAGWCGDICITKGPWPQRKGTDHTSLTLNIGPEKDDVQKDSSLKRYRFSGSKLCLFHETQRRSDVWLFLLSMNQKNLDKSKWSPNLLGFTIHEPKFTRSVDPMGRFFLNHHLLPVSYSICPIGLGKTHLCWASRQFGYILPCLHHETPESFKGQKWRNSAHVILLVPQCGRTHHKIFLQIFNSVNDLLMVLRGVWCYSRHIASRFFHTDFLFTKNRNHYQLHRYWAVLLIIGDRIHIFDINTGRVGCWCDPQTASRFRNKTIATLRLCHFI